MKLEHAERIVDALNDMGIDAQLDKDYSGRGMFGRTTAAITTADPGDVAYAAGQLGLRVSRKVDNMGLAYVVY